MDKPSEHLMNPQSRPFLDTPDVLIAQNNASALAFCVEVSIDKRRIYY
jgi:hypothetical protein